MKIEVYCDESQPDVFWSDSKKKARYLLIGSLWLPASKREKVKLSVNKLKIKNKFTGEIKWKKVHKDRDVFYKKLIDYFFDAGLDLRFRCIVVDGQKVDMFTFHQDDKELGFYKFYYQMLHHWIGEGNKYAIFCDEKTNRAGDRLVTLKKVLSYSNMLSAICNVQALPSREVVIIQLVDFILGIVSSSVNQTLSKKSYKRELIKYFISKGNLGKIQETPKSENKVNIFKIELKRGW